MGRDLDTWRDLQAMGVVVKRAKSFVAFPGYRPEPSRQMKLDLFQENRDTMRPVAQAGGGCASCSTHACGGCPVAGLRAASPVVAGAVG